MKRVIILLALCLLNLSLLAPPSPDVIYLEREEPIFESHYNPTYEPLFQAVAFIESSMRPGVINAKEQAYGLVQIRQCKLDDYTKITGRRLTLRDCLDPKVAKEIFMFFAQGKTFEQAARNWNGKWSLTETYWNKVKARLS
jgi:hypothetical protein